MGASKSKSSEKLNAGQSKEKVSSKALLASKVEAGASEMEELLTGNYKPSFSFVRIFQSIDKNNNGSLEQSELDQFVDKALNLLANHSLAKNEGTAWHKPANTSLASLSGPVAGLGSSCVRDYPGLSAEIGPRVRDKISANLMQLVDTNKNGTIQLEEFEKFDWKMMVERLEGLVNTGVSEPPSRPVKALPTDDTTLVLKSPVSATKPRLPGEFYLPNLVELASREIRKRDYVKVGLPGLLDTTLIQIVEYLIGFGPHSKLTRKDCENFLCTCYTIYAKTKSHFKNRFVEIVNSIAGFYVDSGSISVESPNIPHATAFQLGKDGSVKGEMLFNSIEYSSIPLTQFDLEPVYPSYGNKFKVTTNMMKMYSDKLWDESGRPIENWGKSDKHESLTAPVVEATIEYAGTEKGYIPGILYYLGRKNGTAEMYNYCHPITYEHLQLRGSEVFTSNHYMKPLEEMFSAQRHFNKFEVTPFQGKEAGFWIRADFLRCHIAPTAFLMLLDHNFDYYQKDLIVDLYVEATQDGNHWIILSHIQLVEFSDYSTISSYSDPGLKFEVPAELQGTFYQTFRIRIMANSYISRVTINAFDIFGTVAPVPVAEVEPLKPPAIFSFQARSSGSDEPLPDYPFPSISSRPWDDSPSPKFYYLPRTDDQEAYNEFARTLADRSISLVQTPRRRYEGFRMCGIPLEEQVAEKDCCGGQVETIMNEYLEQYECPINACLKSEIIAAVSRECMRPGGMTEQEVRERLVLLVLESKTAVAF